MGLAASQVRMLSLTSRKASIERDILQGSHRKIALSREMNNLANEYYDALSAERLMYLSDTFFMNGRADCKKVIALCQ